MAINLRFTSCAESKTASLYYIYITSKKYSYLTSANKGNLTLAS